MVKVRLIDGSVREIRQSVINGIFARLRVTPDGKVLDFLDDDGKVITTVPVVSPSDSQYDDADSFIKKQIKANSQEFKF